MRWIVALGVALALASPAAPASAQTRAGSVTDPTGDASLKLDVERLEVSYDPVDGRLTLQVALNPATNPYGFDGDFDVAVGRRAPDGACTAEDPGDLLAANTIVWDFVAGDLEILGTGIVDSIAGPDDGVSERFPAYTYTFEAEELAGRDYRCVLPVSFVAAGDAGTDEVAGFSLQDVPAEPPTTPAPSAPPPASAATPPVGTGATLGRTVGRRPLSVRAPRRRGLLTARKRGIAVRVARRATVTLIQRGRVLARRTGTGRLVLHPKRLRAGTLTMRVSDGVTVVTRRIRIVRRR